MRNINERPICHRAEDLVTYLYGEATQAEARDFSGHLEQCESCKAEFALFRQVHDSILEWRSEALGAASRPIAHREIVSTAVPVHGSTRLSAVAALRQFFTVSPLWLRGAAGLALVLLFMLLGLSAARLFQKPREQTRNVYTQEQIQADIAKEVERQMGDWNRKNGSDKSIAQASRPKANQDERRVVTPRTQTASIRQRRGRPLSRSEREQLEASLRLIPRRDEDELPFVFTNDPNW